LAYSKQRQREDTTRHPGVRKQVAKEYQANLLPSDHQECLVEHPLPARDFFYQVPASFDFRWYIRRQR
jgi:hypothetical protein